MAKNLNKPVSYNFIEAIEDLRHRNIREAQNKLNASKSSLCHDDICALALINIMYSRKEYYNENIRDLKYMIEDIRSTNSEFIITSYGYYLLGRCLAFLGFKTSPFLKRYINLILKQESENELLSESINCYTTSAEMDNKFIDPYFEIALIYDLGLNRKPDAKRFYKKVLEINPNHYISLRKLAELNIEDRMYDEAQNELERIISIYESPTSYLLLSTVYRKQGNISKSREAKLSSKRLERFTLKDYTMSNIGLYYITSPSGIASVPEDYYKDNKKRNKK